MDDDEPFDISVLSPPDTFEESQLPTPEPPPALEYERNIRPLKVVPIKELPQRRPPQSEADFWFVFFRFLRRMCFAVGLGMFGFGLGGKSDSGEVMGWGLFLAGLCIPLGGREIWTIFLSKDRD